MTPRERVGVYAKLVERVLDEVVACVGENDDRPRLFLWGVQRWAAGDDSEKAALRKGWALMFAERFDARPGDPFHWIRGASQFLAIAIDGATSLPACAGHLERALELIGYPADAAKWRVAREHARVLEARAA